MRRLAAVTAIAAAVGLTAATGAEAADRYVALGDSYASGLGTRSYSLNAACKRGRRAYPSIIDRLRPDTTLVFRACAGARTRHVLATQVSSVTAGTDLVTVSIGGNDVGFASVIVRCSALPTERCGEAVDDAEAKARNALPGRLDQVYSEIKRRSPRARVVAIGYPRLFSGTECAEAAGIAAEEQRCFNGAADVLAGVIRARAEAHGLRFVDPRRAYAAHGVCSSERWINGVDLPPTESYHPNRAGHAALAILVRRVIG